MRAPSNSVATSLLWCFMTLLAAGCVLAEAPVPGRALKAALILRLIDFVEWPAEAKGRKTFPLCVVGDEPLAEVLRQSASLLKVDNTRVEVRSYTGLRGASGCPLMIFGAYDERQVRSFLASHRGEPILAVGDSEEFMNAGGTMRIRVDGGRVSIDLSLAAAAAARLQVSSRLARLSNLTDQAEGPGLK